MIVLSFYWLALRKLFPQTKFPQYLFVFFYIFVLEIFKEFAAPAYQKQQTAARMEIFFMRFKMIAEVVYPLGQNRYLYFGAPGIPGMHLKIIDQFCFLFLYQNQFSTSLFLNIIR